MSINTILAEREKTYGDYLESATLAQNLKDSVRAHPSWDNLSPDMRESLDMIMTKIARIINGNPSHADSWCDIAGYATLVYERLDQSLSKSL